MKKQIIRFRRGWVVIRGDYDIFDENDCTYDWLLRYYYPTRELAEWVQRNLP